MDLMSKDQAPVPCPTTSEHSPGKEKPPAPPFAPLFTKRRRALSACPRLMSHPQAALETENRKPSFCSRISVHLPGRSWSPTPTLSAYHFWERHTHPSSRCPSQEIETVWSSLSPSVCLETFATRANEFRDGRGRVDTKELSQVPG